MASTRPTEPLDPTVPVALVAGASRGLGLLIATELASRGFRVHGCARSAEELASAAPHVDAASAQAHPAFVPHVCDVADAAAVEGWVTRVLEHEGHIDVALHVAGTIQVGPLDTMTLGHVHEAVDTMLWGPVHLSLAVLPAMRAAGRGRVGIVSSFGGVISVPHLLPYSVAKFGAVGLAEALHAELSGTGVTATSVTPGLMRTGGHVAARFTGDAERDAAWFSPGGSLPLVSISAERAARRIVGGVLAGRPVVDLTPLAMVGRRVHGLAPATTVRALGLVSRALPRDPAHAERATADAMTSTAPSTSGATARSRLRLSSRFAGRVVDALSTLGDRAARRHHEPR